MTTEKCTLKVDFVLQLPLLKNLFIPYWSHSKTPTYYQNSIKMLTKFTCLGDYTANLFFKWLVFINYYIFIRLCIRIVIYTKYIPATLFECVDQCLA